MNFKNSLSEELVEVNGSNLIDQLGSVEYVLSDKTGTLTGNSMKFKALSVNSNLYEHPNFDDKHPLYSEELRSKLKHPFQFPVRSFLTLILTQSAGFIRLKLKLCCVWIFVINWLWNSWMVNDPIQGQVQMKNALWNSVLLLESIMKESIQMELSRLQMISIKRNSFSVSWTSMSMNRVLERCQWLFRIYNQECSNSIKKDQRMKLKSAFENPLSKSLMSKQRRIISITLLRIFFELCALAIENSLKSRSTISLIGRVFKFTRCGRMLFSFILFFH